MSKAFTRETDGDDEDDGIALPPLPVGGKNYITPAGYARLRAELLGLMDEERPKVVEAVHWAAKNGDRSENGDYLYGKKRLREIDRRIRFLTKRLEIAEVTDRSALTLPLFRVALNPRFTRPFYAVPRTSAARTASAWGMRRNPGDWSARQTSAMHWLQRCTLKSARAWRLKMALRAV